MASSQFHPGADRWERRPAPELGLDPAALGDAVRYAESHEIGWPRDLTRIIPAEPPPYDALLGPLVERGGPTGLVVRHGVVAAEWGDPARVDVTFSATKTYLTALAGLAWDRGLIPDLDQPVGATVRDGGFDSPHNARITWRHLLQQTSEWEGTLFGLPDQVDHNRAVGGAEPGARKGEARELREPGSWWEYNDVRVNRTALALLRVLGAPLPEVLRREVMRPIGASDTWQWHGYESSWVDLDGRRVQSVSGGAHWGGGLHISSFDHARFGLLLLRRGRWDGAQLVSEAWIDLATAPCEHNPGYGFLVWLNTGRRLLPGASESAFAAQGAGGNCVVIEPERDLVVVTRWCSDVPGVVARAVAAAR